MASDREGKITIKIRPEHWGINDRPAPIDVGKLKAGDGISRPNGFDGYVRALGMAANQLAAGQQIGIEQHNVIARYGQDPEIIKNFDSRRIGYNELPNLLTTRGQTLWEVTEQTRGPSMRV